MGIAIREVNYRNVAITLIEDRLPVNECKLLIASNIVNSGLMVV